MVMRRSDSTGWQIKIPENQTGLCRNPHLHFAERRTFCRRPPDWCAGIRIQVKKSRFGGLAALSVGKMLMTCERTAK
jgi:hypothetical protein